APIRPGALFPGEQVSTCPIRAPGRMLARMIRNERFIPADAGDYAATAARARGLLEAGEIDQAIAHYDQALRADPYYADGFNNRGLAWLRKGDLERAIEDFSEAIR